MSAIVTAANGESHAPRHGSLASPAAFRPGPHSCPQPSGSIGRSGVYAVRPAPCRRPGGRGLRNRAGRCASSELGRVKGEVSRRSHRASCPQPACTGSTRAGPPRCIASRFSGQCAIPSSTGISSSPVFSWMRTENSAGCCLKYAAVASRRASGVLRIPLLLGQAPSAPACPGRRRASQHSLHGAGRAAKSKARPWGSLLLVPVEIELLRLDTRRHRAPCGWLRQSRRPHPSPSPRAWVRSRRSA